MKNNVFEDINLTMEYYKTQADDYRMRHTAIWTEVQHYTWVLSILLGAGPVAAIGETNLSSTQLGFLFFMPLVGIFVALLAFLIIRRDFVYFTRADARLLYLEKKLGVTLESDYLDNRLKRAENGKLSVSDDVSQQKPIKVNDLLKPRIRAFILGIFVIYMIAGVVEIAYFSYLLLK
jgi:phosphate/sulfate permease